MKKQLSMSEVFENVATTTEAAKELGVTSRHIWYMWKHDQLKGELKGHTLLIYRPSLETAKKNRQNIPS